MGRGRKKAYERAKVLADVMDLFWQKGFDGASLDEIVKKTGLNRFSLYSEFGDKDQLFKEALLLYLNNLETTFSPLRREPFGFDNVREYFFQLDMRFFKNSCFMLNTFVTKSSVPKAAFQRAAQTAQLFEELLAKNLIAARARGEIRKDLDVPVLTGLLATIDLGLVIRNLNSPKNSEKDKIVEVLLESIQA